MSTHPWKTLVCLSLTATLCSGFDFATHGIPIDKIRSGGPAKDGIPAILEPQFLTAAQATFLSAEDHVLGVIPNDVAKAYPLRILVWHEVVNDRVGDTPVAVTY